MTETKKHSIERFSEVFKILSVTIHRYIFLHKNELSKRLNLPVEELTYNEGDSTLLNRRLTNLLGISLRNELEKLESEIRNTWRTTKQIADGLNVSTKTILGYFYAHKKQFEGLTYVSPIETERGLRDQRIWHPETIKVFGLGISNEPVEKWKDEVINEVVEKGMIVTNSIKALGNSENRLQLIKLQSQQIIAMVDEIEDVKSDIKLLQEKAKNVFVIPTTRKFLRDEVHRVALEYFNGDHYEVWVPLRNKYKISSYHELTEEQAQLELGSLRKEYPSKNNEV